MSFLRTPEHRKRRAELIRQWKPWEYSTGPKSAEGKAASLQNATFHGMYSREALDDKKRVNAIIKQAKENLERVR